MTNEMNDRIEKNNGDPAMEEDLDLAQDTVSKYLTFFSDGQGFAINSDYVIEIINEYSITHLPCVPPFIKGIINLRGQIVPIMDMRLRLGRAASEESKEACIIVIAVDADSVGLLVDQVSQMTDVDEDQLSPTPEHQKDVFINGFARIDEAVYLTLNCESLISII